MKSVETTSRPVAKDGSITASIQAQLADGELWCLILIGVLIGCA